ncbi:MAG: tetratricopeptide repeat protein [Oscillospiraceae bacterium]|jgi:tetratricopeptide (TPR) repeat protein|nr:tetratricopeptide repeat protein [Oscillospiraceae bacterium]
MREVCERMKGMDIIADYDKRAHQCCVHMNYPEAIEWLQKALAISEESLGREHSTTEALYNNTAAVLEEQGDFSGAVLWYKKALAICEKRHGANHWLAAGYHGSIADAYKVQREFTEALAWYRKALAVYEKTYGAANPSTMAMRDAIAAMADNTRRDL